MNILGAADKAHGGHAETPLVKARFDGFDNLEVIGQAEIIVGAHIQHLLFTDADAGLLGGCDPVFGFVKTGFGDFPELLFQFIAIFSIHDCLPSVLKRFVSKPSINNRCMKLYYRKIN